MCAFLYIIKNGCKRKALLSEYRHPHMVWVKFSSWSKNGEIDRIFEALQIIHCRGHGEF